MSGATALPAPSTIAPARRRFRLSNRGRSQVRQIVRDPVNVAALLVVAVILIVCIAAPLIATHDPNALSLRDKLKPPSLQHLFGTDEAGRDLFSRMVYGARLSVTLGFVILIVTVLIGTILGGIAGYVGGWLDYTIMRLADFFIAFPYLVLAMAIAFALGASTQNAVISVIIVFWPSYARLIRNQVVSISQRDFVQAAKVTGASRTRILLHHILPQTWTSLIVQFSLDLGFAIVALASLGFIGLGAQPPTAEWGTIIAQSRTYAVDNWWYGLIPGITITVTVVAFNLVGDLLHELIDPTMRTR
jgi:peptide/nickel transport system permease protein